MISDSFTVVAQHGWLVLGILLVSAWIQILLSRLLRFVFGERLTSGEYLALSLTGWLVPVSLLSFLWRLFGPIPTLTALIVLTVLLIRLPLPPNPAPDSPKITFALLTFVSTSILLRLIFVSQAVLPSYFDSAQHYLFIKDILQNDAQSTLAPANYYHQGFHTLAAFLAATLRADISAVILILGQMIVVLIPVALFLPVRYATRSEMAGLFAVILAAFGWYMPAHAVNWGKYPALMSLGIFPFGFSLTYLLVQHRQGLATYQRRWLYVLLGLGVIVTVLAHTRTLFAFALVCLAWGAAVVWQKLGPRLRYALWFACLSILVLEVLVIQRQPLLAQVFDPYLERGVWVSVLVLGLSLFAGRFFPQWMFACLSFMVFLFGSLFVPVWVPGYGSLTLLDRPYVQMLLFLPLSVLGGLGLAGAGRVKFIPQLQQEWSMGVVSILVGSVIVVHAFQTYDFHPSDCCVIAGQDDVLALTWLDEHLPAEARVGIATTEMNVLPSEVFEGLSGSDAGIWIKPLTNRLTVMLPANLDFGQPATFEMLCQLEVSHLYVGAVGQSFDAAQLNTRPDWYRELYSMPKVKVFEVRGCLTP